MTVLSGAFARRIARERAFLDLLEGARVKVRWRGFVESGYGKLPLKQRMLGLVLLLPQSVGDWLLNRR